jgi:hypothetical protein
VKVLAWPISVLELGSEFTGNPNPEGNLFHGVHLEHLEKLFTVYHNHIAGASEIERPTIEPNLTGEVKISSTGSLA